MKYNSDLMKNVTIKNHNNRKRSSSLECYIPTSVNPNPTRVIGNSPGDTIASAEGLVTGDDTISPTVQALSSQYSVKKQQEWTLTKIYLEDN